MRILLSATTTIGLLLICVQTTSAFTRVCRFRIGQYSTAISPFFTSWYINDPELPCRYKLANFRCGKVDVNIEADYAKHAHPTYSLTNIINSLNVRATLNGNSTTFTITNDSFHQYVQNGQFHRNPWQKQGNMKLHGYFNQTLMAAVIKDGGLLIEYYYRRETSRKWTKGIEKRTDGPLLNIKCLNKVFQSNESFPYSLCGNLEYTFDMTKYNEDLPLDSHHLSYLGHLFADYTMLRHHNVQHSNPQCAEASAILRGGPCQSRSPIRLPGDNILLCVNLYRYHRVALERKGLDSFKWLNECLRAVCQSDGKETPQDTCSAIYDWGREVLKDYTDHSTQWGDYTRILEVTTCPPDPALPAPTNRPFTNWPEGCHASKFRRLCLQSIGLAKCAITDRSVNWYQKFSSLQPFTPDGYYVTFNSACRYIMADIQCSGAKAVVEVGFSRTVGGFVYPSDTTVYITIPADDGHVTSQTFDLSIAAAQSFVTSGDMQLSYNDTYKSVTLVRDGLTVTMTYIDPNDAQRPDSTPIVSVECAADDFSSTDQLDSLCGRPVVQRQQKLIRLNLHYDEHLDVLFLGKQGLQQRSDECRGLQLAVNASREKNCLDFGDILWECQNLLNPWTVYGNCIARENLDRVKIQSSCIHSLCQTEEAGKPETCSILRTVADLCGASPPRTYHNATSFVNLHIRMSKILEIGGCN